jgi:chromosomal replication initiation ATPase DnaA
MTAIKQRVLMKSKDRIDYVFTNLCNYWNIPREDFLKRARTKDRYYRKRIVVKILRDEAEVSFKEISNSFGRMGDEANTWEIYQRVSSDLDKHTFGNLELKRDYEKIKRYLQI